MPYQSIKLNISDKKQKDALQGKSITLKKADLQTGQTIYLHPLNYKKIINAKGGVTLKLSPGEIMHTAAKHGLLKLPANTSNMTGAGFFDDVWSGLKTAGKWLVDSGVASNLADALVPVASSVIGPTGAQLGRKLLKGVTGVGLTPDVIEKPVKVSKTKTVKGCGLYL